MNDKQDSKPEGQKASNESAHYLGQDKASALTAAANEGLRTRIVREDQQRYPITRDLRPDRINFEIDGGKVTSARRY